MWWTRKFLFIDMIVNMFHVHHYTQQERSPTGQKVKMSSNTNPDKLLQWQYCRGHLNLYDATNYYCLLSTFIFFLCSFYGKKVWLNDVRLQGSDERGTEMWGEGEGPLDYFFSFSKIYRKHKLNFWLNTALYWKLWKKQQGLFLI